MDAQADTIVDISDAQVRFFGGPGKMLIPCVATVEAMVNKVPAGRLITTDLLRKALAEQFKVQGTCPVTTRKALQAIAKHSSKQVAYWRVIKQNGELIDKFPGGVEGQAARLRNEGFMIDATGKAPKVKDFKKSLVRFTK